MAYKARENGAACFKGNCRFFISSHVGGLALSFVEGLIPLDIRCIIIGHGGE